MGGLSDKDGGPVLPPLVKSQIGLLLCLALRAVTASHVPSSFQVQKTYPNVKNRITILKRKKYVSIDSFSLLWQNRSQPVIDHLSVRPSPLNLSPPQRTFMRSLSVPACITFFCLCSGSLRFLHPSCLSPNVNTISFC